MRDATRGISTLIGAAVAGFLIWLAAQMGVDRGGEYWATYGLIAAAGLTMALSQVLGGWTKWGWPRLSAGVFLLGFLPVLVVGGWVLLAEQPGNPALATAAWSEDIGIEGVVADLGSLLPAIAFGIGLVLGFVFDTDGPRLEPTPGAPIETRTPSDASYDGRAADEPLTAERRADVDDATVTREEDASRSRWRLFK